MDLLQDLFTITFRKLSPLQHGTIAIFDLYGGSIAKVHGPVGLDHGPMPDAVTVDSLSDDILFFVSPPLALLAGTAGNVDTASALRLDARYWRGGNGPALG